MGTFDEQKELAQIIQLILPETAFVIQSLQVLCVTLYDDLE